MPARLDSEFCSEACRNMHAQMASRPPSNPSLHRVGEGLGKEEEEEAHRSALIVNHRHPNQDTQHPQTLDHPFSHTSTSRPYQTPGPQDLNA